MDLQNALASAEHLRGALTAEVERARGERQLLRSLDAAGLFARASERSAFVAEVARHERALTISIARAAGQLGLTTVSLEAIRLRAPREGAALQAVVSDVRALAGALKEIDSLNLQLAGRALSCVRGYVEALSPTPRTYDRRGGRSSAPALAMVSTKG